MATGFANPVSPLGGGVTEEQAKFSWSDDAQKYAYFGVLGVTALLIYSYWNTLSEASAFWQDAQYSHGYLVPFIALYIAWSMRPNPAAQTPMDGEAEETFLGLMPASLLLKGGLGLGGALLAAGVYLNIPVLQGVGLAAACLAGMAYVFIGQPFRAVSATERWAGLGILLLAYGIRIGLGAYFYLEPLDRFSFVVAMLGGFVLVGGWSLLKWAGPALGFLLFMFPIPSIIEKPLLLNLQKLAAAASEVVLTILGQPVHREGSVIHVAGVSDPLAVAEACSGLRMLTIFGGFAVACALLIKRPWWDKLIILLSAVPIALFVNITRIVVTALLFRMAPESQDGTFFGWDSSAITQLFHDFPGYGMMFLAMGLMYLELKVLKMLSTEEEEIGQYGGGSFGSAGPMPTA